MVNNLADFIFYLVDLIIELGLKIWYVLTTPFSEMFADMDSWFGDLLGDIFNGLIGQYTLLSALVPLLVVFILFKIYRKIRG